MMVVRFYRMKKYRLRWETEQFKEAARYEWFVSLFVQR